MSHCCSLIQWMERSLCSSWIIATHERKAHKVWSFGEFQKDTLTSRLICVNFWQEIYSINFSLIHNYVDCLPRLVNSNKHSCLCLLSAFIIDIRRLDSVNKNICAWANDPPGHEPWPNGIDLTDRRHLLPSSLKNLPGIYILALSNLSGLRWISVKPACNGQKVKTELSIFHVL